jgi:single-strand DNA-binding protein
MLNVVALNGRLTADPELRHTNSDIPVTSFTLAVDRSYQKQGQNRQADFIDVVCWRNTAEFASRYFKKGQLVAVEGSIQTRSYTDNQGNKRKAFEIVANNVHFAEPRRDSGGQPSIDVSPGDNGDFVEIDGDDDLPF